MVYLFWGYKSNKVQIGRAPTAFSALTTHFIVELDFYDGIADTGHRGPQINICGFVFQPTAAGVGAGEVTEVFPVVQLVVQMFVAGTGLLNHANGQPVLVQVAVEGHGEHDGHALGTNAALHMEQVVGQQADSARGGVVVLDEGAHLCLGGANRGLGRMLTEATCHVHLGVDEAVAGADICYFDGAVSVGGESG